MDNKKYIEQYALDDAVELAFEIDSYLRTNNPDYDRIYSEVRETQEDLADNIMVGKTDKIKQVFDDMGLTSSDEPLSRLYEYEEKYPHSVQDKKPFWLCLSADKSRIMMCSMQNGCRSLYRPKHLKIL